eukprot:scaffold389_cov382-Prasinococcus_capsulatus_cf.AAC.1
MEYLRAPSSRADADAGPYMAILWPSTVARRQGAVRHPAVVVRLRDAAVVVKAQAVADVGGKVDVAAQAHALLAALSHEAAKSAQRSCGHRGSCGGCGVARTPRRRRGGNEEPRRVAARPLCAPGVTHSRLTGSNERRVRSLVVSAARGARLVRGPPGACAHGLARGRTPADVGLWRRGRRLQQEGTALELEGGTGQLFCTFSRTRQRR